MIVALQFRISSSLYKKNDYRLEGCDEEIANIFSLDSPSSRGLKPDVIPGSPPFDASKWCAENPNSPELYRFLISLALPFDVRMQFLRDRKGVGFGGGFVRKPQHIGRCNATRSHVAAKRELVWCRSRSSRVYSSVHR